MSGAMPPRFDPRGLLRTDGRFWRELASFGASRAPDPLLRYAPPGFALAFALALPKVRKQVRENLRAVLGPRTPSEEALDVFRTFSHFASCLAESLALDGAEPRSRDARCKVFGAVDLDQAIAQGRGVIVVTAHTGAWETAGPLLKEKFGADVLFVMEQEPDAGARAIHDRHRERAGMRVAHVGSDPLASLPLFSHLRRGGVLGIQIDRAPKGMRAIDVRLFDREARVPSGPFWLARATGAPIVPVFAIRRGHFLYDIHIGPPQVLPRGASPEMLSLAAQAVTTEMERVIRAHPTHWFHFGHRDEAFG